MAKKDETKDDKSEKRRRVSKTSILECVILFERSMGNSHLFPSIVNGIRISTLAIEQYRHIWFL